MSFYSGFYNFNNDEGLNFQLNRFYCSGFLTYDELIDIGCKVTDFESWIDLFTELAEKAEADGDAIKAATCYRAAQYFFDLSDVTLIGISLGGYLATRAAAYDSRISRLIMYDLIYDFYGAIVARMGKTKGKLFNKMTSDPNHLLWKPIEKKLRRNYFTNWLLHQGYLVYEGVSTPYEYFNYIKRFNTRNISAKIKQDTLVLAGKKDIYTIFCDQQLAALKNAKSVTGRLFTAEENADHHCQVGNLQLVLDVMMNWIKEKTAQYGTELRESSSQ